MNKTKLIRISTVPLSLKMFCRELLAELADDYDVLAVSSSGKELDELRDDGIPVVSLEMERSIAPISDLRSLIQIIKLFKRVKPEIVHSMTPKAGLLAMIAAYVTGVPIRIHSFTGLLFPSATGIKKLILKTTDRITCACATHILPEGEGVKHDLITGKITRKPLKVLGNGNLRGINLDYYNLSDKIREEAQKIREKIGIAPKDFVFVFVGRIVKDKGIVELAQAFRRLSKDHNNVHLTLVGVQEPKEAPLTDDTLKILNETPQIHLTNSWAEDVRPYYASADALVFPSYREGFPNVVLEAGALGLPSIVTDINGSREIIVPKYNGDIIPPHDAEALYAKMHTYITDRQYVDTLRKNCRKHIADKYEAKYVRKCLKDFYASTQP